MYFVKYYNEEYLESSIDVFEEYEDAASTVEYLEGAGYEVELFEEE